MGAADARIQLVRDLNNAFGQANIVETARRIQELSPRADFLTMTRAAGVLGDMPAATFRRYRQVLTFGRTIQQILTLAHREALSRDPPSPIHFEINDASPPSIEVTVADRLVSIRLNRPDPTPRSR